MVFKKNLINSRVCSGTPPFLIYHFVNLLLVAPLQQLLPTQLDCPKYCNIVISSHEKVGSLTPIMYPNVPTAYISLSKSVYSSHVPQMYISGKKSRNSILDLTLEP
jgi:hypothetical protein